MWYVPGAGFFRELYRPHYRESFPANNKKSMQARKFSTANDLHYKVFSFCKKYLTVIQLQTQEFNKISATDIIRIPKFEGCRTQVTNPKYPCYITLCVGRSKEPQGYKSNVSLKRGATGCIHMQFQINYATQNAVVIYIHNYIQLVVTCGIKFVIFKKLVSKYCLILHNQIILCVNHLLVQLAIYEIQYYTCKRQSSHKAIVVY